MSIVLAGGTAVAAAPVQIVTGVCCGRGSICGTLLSASDATWQPEMTCPFLGPESYAVSYW